MRARRAAADCFLERERGEQAEHQADADQQEHVAVAHHEGLAADDAADGDDGLVLGDQRIGDAVGLEIVRQVGDALARRLVEQRDRIHQHVGMELLALGDQGLQVAMPMAPPRLRVMLNRPEAEPAFSASMPALATTDSGVITSAWPIARTMLAQNSWSAA